MSNAAVNVTCRQQMSDLDKLILELKRYYPYTEAARPDYFKFILCYSQLVEVLEKINTMVGMNSIKDDLAARFRSLTVYYAEHGNLTSVVSGTLGAASNSINSSILIPHTLMMSEPGMGKTQLGSYLAEFWTVVGILRQKPQDSTNFKWSTIDAEAELRNGLGDKHPGNLTPKRNSSFDIFADSFTQGQRLEGQRLEGQRLEGQRLEGQRLEGQRRDSVMVSDRKGTPTLLSQVEGQRAGQLQIEGQRTATSNEVYTLLNKTLEERSITMVNRIQRHSHSKHPTIRREYQELKTLIHKLAGNQTAQEPVGSVTPLRVALNPSAVLVPWWKRSEKRVHSIFRVTTKADFISRIQGGSTYQLRRLLKECEGGCIMIDEAYSIVTSEEDSFGKEVLAEIVSVMSTYDCIMFIFAGYKDSIKELTRKQQGLISRFNYIYEIEPYTNQEIYQIFNYHCRSMKLKSDVAFNTDIFNQTVFPAYGRDVNALVKICSQYIYDRSWNQLCSPLSCTTTVSTDKSNKVFKVDMTIDQQLFDSALKTYRRTKNPLGNSQPADKFYHDFMYS